MKMSNSTKDPKQKNSREKDTAANVDEEGFSEEQAALDSDAIHLISKAFGGPMARLQIRESRRLSQRLTTETSSEHSDYAKGERSPRSAPRALLYGRLDHYNRIGQNWRLVVENVRVTKRKQLLRERTKRKRCSLWRAASIPPVGCRDERNQECNEGRNLVFHECEEIQILGYDDL
ncbi:unnamed protein product [Cylindrotheca closterium]|uniref:Uncharacterized protein n=1 Tax=Cylindrotheca closterium TaxID=2856 RepID=A0AAD2CXY2_9STRA|nr:unnamed protein product [Cylindrotheca closterium]